MKLLAFETATEACSVALYVDGQVVERYEVAPRRHAELALPWAEALLAPERLTREGYFNVQAVQEMWRDHQTRARDREHQLWNVLMFQSWLENS